MRRTSAALILLIMTSAFGQAAWAGTGSPHIAVDDEVTQGQRLRIVVTDCVSGEDWTARIVVELQDGAATLRRRVFPVDKDGVTRVGVRIASARFDPGRYGANVACTHTFGDGSRPVYFDEREPFVVLRRS